MSVRINSEQAKALGLSAPPAGRSKYRAKRTEYNGVLYASKLEAEYAAKLDAEMAAGRVVWWLGQPRFRLGCPENLYIADFLVALPGEPEWAGVCFVHAVDCKGFVTPKFRRTVRLWERYGPVQLWVVHRDFVDCYPPGTDVEGPTR